VSKGLARGLGKSLTEHRQEHEFAATDALPDEHWFPVLRRGLGLHGKAGVAVLQSRQLSDLISTFFDMPLAGFPHHQWIQRVARGPADVALASGLRYLASAESIMFKISVVDTRSQRRLVVEGTLVGAWVAELRTSWRNACLGRGGRKLIVDLRNLTTISREGEGAIFDLIKEGAKFSCGDVLTKHVLKQLERKKQQESLPR